jgi:hypothetical protein
VWLRAQKHGFRTTGLPVPWAYIRRELAKGWFTQPWVLDGSDEPPDMAEEIRIELRIRALEVEAER